MLRYTLEPVSRSGDAIDFAWDPVRGELAGPGAGEVRLLVEQALRAGYWIGHPHPTSYVMTDPLRRPAELAVILATFWRLPGDLAACHPKLPDELPPGAIP